MGFAANGDPLAERDALAEGALVGEYRVTGFLGRGGMGAVYAGVQELIHKPVAIKILNGYRSGSDAVERFVQEARLVNQIGHPNIVDIFAFGQLSDGRPYYVMELLKGRPLSQFLADKGALSHAEALPILRGIADGLEAAHARNVVHRDLKADNVFVVEQLAGPPRIKLLDFGIAKMLGSSSPSLTKTRTGTRLGSPPYMSPEQCRGGDVDRRSDVYSFGVIAYLAFTGRLPFRADSRADFLHMQVHATPLAPSWVNGVPVPIEKIILRALAKPPEDRYQNLSDLIRDLEAVPEDARRWRPGIAEDAGDSSIETMTRGVESSARESGAERAPTPRSERHVWPIVGAVLGTLAVVGFVLHTRAQRHTAVAPVAELVPSLPRPSPAAPPKPIAAPPALVAEPKPVKPVRFGTLDLQSVPSAAIEIDGKPIGKMTPQSGIRLSAGRHLVVLKQRGYPTKRTFVTIAAEQTLSQFLTLDH